MAAMASAAPSRLLLRILGGGTGVEKLGRRLGSTARLAQRRRAVLAPYAAKVRVIVERARLQRLERVDIARAQVDAIDEPDAKADRRGGGSKAGVAALSIGWPAVPSGSEKQTARPGFPERAAVLGRKRLDLA